MVMILRNVGIFRRLDTHGKRENQLHSSFKSKISSDRAELAVIEQGAHICIERL